MIEVRQHIHNETTIDMPTPVLRSTVRVAAVGLALLALSAVPAETRPQTEDLYVCAAEARADATPIGVTVCDATATPILTERAEVENLQVRDGALVVDLAAAGVSETAGLQPGDMIYRVGGVDVTDARTAVATLGEIGTTADTIVNFLRRGRPYRVKLRRN
jgi:C-terminal processing protease CtpA/Prc